MIDTTAGPMAGQTVLVTGGTGGIGQATAIGLAAMGARVGVTGRDISRTRAAAADIAAASGNPAVDPFPADMSSQAEVRRLAGEVLAAYPRLDVLVNNVGGFWATRRVTADELEHTFAVNHLAPFLLTSLLLDRLKASAPARIVTVSSGAHATGKMNFDDLLGERRYSGQEAYSQSKLANVMFTYELARRVEGTGVTATVLHPGVVRTGFAAEDPSPMLKVFLPLIRLSLKTPEKGAATSIYLASSPEVAGVTGKYFVGGKPKTSSPSSYDTAAASRLWQISLDLTGRTAGSLAGHFRDTLRHGTRRAQRHVRLTQPPDQHGFAVAHARVIGVCRAAGAPAFTPVPDQHVAPGLHRGADSRIEFVQRLGGGGRYPLPPLVYRGRSGLPGRGELPCRVAFLTTHNRIFSPGTVSGQRWGRLPCSLCRTGLVPRPGSPCELGRALDRGAAAFRGDRSWTRVVTDAISRRPGRGPHSRR